jgi:biopolymer transport protein ExbD
MFAYTLFVFSRFSRRYYLARRESRALVPDYCRAVQLSQRTIVAELNRGLQTLKAIASAAPFLGLAGTSYGILAGLSVGFTGSRARVEAIISARIAAALITAAAGIIVAVPAILTHNLLRTRVARFERESASMVFAGVAAHAHQNRPRPFRLAQTLPLKRRFSGLPPFALVAAPALASVVAMFMSFEPYKTPTGLPVGLASDRCKFDSDDRLIVLRITDTGKLFINTEPVDWKGLAGRLSAIYDMRKYRTLDLLAEDGVPFQTVADAIDIAENAPVTRPSEPNIRVLLITPRAENADCLAPIWIRPTRHTSR